MRKMPQNDNKTPGAMDCSGRSATEWRTVIVMKKNDMKSENVVKYRRHTCLASPSGKMTLLTKKKITMEMPPLRMVVPML